jgi:hypothetical protein
MKNDPEIAAIVARWKQEEALEATKTVAKSRDIDYGHER